jgi:hypothetical protein
MTGALKARLPNGQVSTLFKDRRGIVALEFAVLAPIVILFFTGVWALINIQLGGVALEGGIAAASRQAIIGPSNVTGTREDMIREVVARYVCPRATGDGTVCYWDESLLSGNGDGVDPLIIDMRAYIDPRNIGQPEPFTDLDNDGVLDPGEPWTDSNGNGSYDTDMGHASAGGAGDYVVFEVTMAQPVVHPLLIPVLGRSHRHAAKVVIRNEPWGIP